MADKLKGQLSIHRVYGGDTKEIRIEVEDVDARCMAFTVYVPLDNFAESLMGSSGNDCEFEYSSKIGTIGESKEELVPVPSTRKDGWQGKALKPFMVDGWYPRSGDIDNYTHRRAKVDGKDYQRVVFFRNIPKEKK